MSLRVVQSWYATYVCLPITTHYKSHPIYNGGI